MIDLRDEQHIYRILGVDNGTDTIGAAVIDHHLLTGVSTVVHYETLTASKTAYSRFEGRMNAQGKLKARLDAIRPWTFEVLEEFDPDAVGIESPFQHLQAHAFGSLTTSMNVVEEAVFLYCSTLPLYKISPGSAKSAVCLAGEYGTSKEHIAEQLEKNPKIIMGPGVIFANADEHSRDGMAVGHCVGIHASLNAMWHKEGKKERVFQKYSLRQ